MARRGHHLRADHERGEEAIEHLKRHRAVGRLAADEKAGQPVPLLDGQGDSLGRIAVLGGNSCDADDLLIGTDIEPYRTTWDALGNLPERPNDPTLAMTGKWADLLPSILEGENYLWHTPHGGGKPLFGWLTYATGASS